MRICLTLNGQCLVSCSIIQKVYFNAKTGGYIVNFELFASQVFPSTKRPWSLLFPAVKHEALLLTYNKFIVSSELLYFFSFGAQNMKFSNHKAPSLHWKTLIFVYFPSSILQQKKKSLTDVWNSSCIDTPVSSHTQTIFI